MSAARPVLVLVPGLLNDADLWRDPIAGLADVAECRVADITRGETLDALAQGILDAAPPRFALAGFSLGGFVAVEVARRAPGRLTHLALLDTSIEADTPERLAGRRTLDRAARAPGRFHGFGDRLLDTYLAPGHRHDEGIAGRIRTMTERLGAEVFLRQNALERRDGAGVLAGLTCPVLVLCGAHDAVTPPAGHVAMAGLVPHATLMIVPGAGHMTPIEEPAAVVAAMRAWLARPAA